MSHPIVRPDSLRPGYIHSLETSLVTVVTGHTGYDILEKEVGWKLTFICDNTHFHNCKTLRLAEEYVGCLKAVGSVYNCSAVGCYFSLQPAGRCVVTIDRQTLNDSPAFLSLCLPFISPSLFPPAIGPHLHLFLSVFHNEIHYCYR